MQFLGRRTVATTALGAKNMPRGLALQPHGSKYAKRFFQKIFLSKMASKEMAAMLDELMGRNRNANPNDKVGSMYPLPASSCDYLTQKFYLF